MYKTRAKSASHKLALMTNKHRPHSSVLNRTQDSVLVDRNKQTELLKTVREKQEALETPIPTQQANTGREARKLKPPSTLVVQTLNQKNPTKPMKFFRPSIFLDKNSTKLAQTTVNLDGKLSEREYKYQ